MRRLHLRHLAVAIFKRKFESKDWRYWIDFHSSYIIQYINMHSSFIIHHSVQKKDSEHLSIILTFKDRPDQESNLGSLGFRFFSSLQQRIRPLGYSATIIILTLEEEHTKL